MTVTSPGLSTSVPSLPNALSKALAADSWGATKVRRPGDDGGGDDVDVLHSDEEVDADAPEREVNGVLEKEAVADVLGGSGEKADVERRLDDSGRDAAGVAEE